jgi:hypothetical protein
MASITVSLVLGDDAAVYNALIAALPAGDNNLNRGSVIPAHPENMPLTFEVDNVTIGASYIIDFQGEWSSAPNPRVFFVPITTKQNLTVALPYGPVTVTLHSPTTGEFYRYILSVTNYATLFRVYAGQITGYSVEPLTLLQNDITNPLAYRLALPMLAGLTDLIPTDLETLATLSNKLLVKSMRSNPGTLGATSDILAAFSASNPIFFQMLNIDQFDSPLFRSEEVYQGYEAHVWLPNLEVERWKAFITLLNNLPQLYTLEQITEGEVWVTVGNRLQQHIFDFDSAYANSIIAGASSIDCFLNLFKLTVTVQSEHFLAFCQASYFLDRIISNALSPTDADPLNIVPFSKFSLSGRFSQQYDINPGVHSWIYDTPLAGVVDGVNRFFTLSKLPASTSAVKIFVDGLLKYPYIDYRISISGSFISGAYKVLALPQGPLLIDIDLGIVRSFQGPVFSNLECKGGSALQMLLTGVEQGLDKVAFIISHPPTTDPTDPQAIAIHYITPNTPNSGDPGDDQYGQVPLTAGISSYGLTFTQPTSTIDYQLFISLTVDPMPSSDPTKVSQVTHIVREHTQTGATIEFSAPLAANTTLNWWVLETDHLTLERGTILLSDGIVSTPITFANGPYFDQVVVILQLWEINPTFMDAAQYLVSCLSVGPGQTIVSFSGAISGSTYRLDYAVFAARAGNFVEFFLPPIGLVEAHYDISWPYWINAALSPMPDGIRTEFALSFPIANPKSIYLVLDGRLMTQGANNQYTVYDSTVLFTFPPTANQIPWAVYPVVSSGELPSAWTQGFLTYLPTNLGEYATGWIRIPNTITVGSTVSVGDVVFNAVASSEGLLVNGTYITVGSSVSWGTLGVTLTAVSGTPANENQFTVGISKDADTASLLSVINAHSILNIYYVAIAGGSGFIKVNAKELGGGFYNEILTAFGSITALSILGDSAPCSYNSYMLYYGEHVISITSSLSIIANTFYHSNHALYEGLGVKVVTTGTLPSPLMPSTLYYITNPTSNSFQLALTPYGTPITLTTVGVGYQTFTSQDIEVETSTFSFHTTSVSLQGNLSLGSPIITSIIPNTSALTVGMGVIGTNIPTNAIIASIDALNQITLNTNATGTALLSSFTSTNVFRNKEPVSFLTEGTLPAGLNVGQKYYAINITENRFQVSETLNGTPVVFTDAGSKAFKVTSVPRFVSGNTQSLDTLSLATEIKRHPITSALVTADIIADGLIKVIASNVGLIGNSIKLEVVDPEVTSEGLSAGQDPTELIYIAPDISYYYDAPVIALDGLSTRLWEEYEGSKFKFTYPPTMKQESYFISEVFPLDLHPLDSTVANNPCNYPKGLFTQGFGTHFNETDIPVDQPGTLIISISNLPVQERPQGIINGINRVFTLTYVSSAGQDSLMVWLDGIFQPPPTYTYSDMGVYGVITFLTAPVVGQELWAWYLPSGSSYIDERVRELTGTIDGSNQIFSVPDSPWANDMAITVYLEGLFVTQNLDYSVINTNTQIQFLGTVAPDVGQSLWGHYNLGSIVPVDNWRQVFVAITDGVSTTYLIPHLLNSELPTSIDSVLVFLDGLNQGGHFTIEVDFLGYPTGNIIFNSAPEANRQLEVAYIRRS